MAEERPETQTIKIKNLIIKLEMLGDDEADKFLDELQALCKKHAVKDDWHFNFNVEE